MIKPMRMWAIVARSDRSEWIIVRTVRRTRREAVAAYLAEWDKAFHATMLANCRAVKVTLTVGDR